LQIGGRVWNDLDKDKVIDNDETGISGVLLILRTDTNQDGEINESDGVVAAAISDLAGGYAMTDILPATYLLAATTPPGYFATTPSRVVLKGTLLLPAAVVNFGNRLYWQTYLPTCVNNRW
jgi:hypothetical protein